MEPEPHPRPPTRLRFDFGGFQAEGFELRFSRGRVLYRHTVGSFPDSKPRELRPTEPQWSQFWQEVDRIGVWQWTREYWNHDVLDGIQWSLELRCGERRVKSEGSNCYPGSTGPGYPADSPFAQFLRALAHLTGLAEIAFKEESAARPPNSRAKFSSTRRARDSGGSSSSSATTS